MFCLYSVTGQEKLGAPKLSPRGTKKRVPCLSFAS